MVVIISGCCNGTGANCRRGACALYQTAQSKVSSDWPREPTGFGNAYGEPSHGNFLARVRMVISEPEKPAIKRRNRLPMTFEDWAVKRRREAYFLDDLNRICRVSERVASLPCGCVPNKKGELLVWQSFDPQTRKSQGFTCAMGKNHDQLLYPVTQSGGHPFLHWRK